MLKFKLFILLSFAVNIFSCSTQPYVVEGTENTNDTTLVKIYIVNHGWHTGIIVPADKLHQQLPALKNRFAQAVYLELGWGDQGFYQAEEITTGLTLNAILWPTASVVHVVSLSENVPSYFSNMEVLCVPRNAYAALITFLVNSFARDEEGHIITMGKGIYGDSQFYQGTGSYHLFNTCNKWTAKGLKSAGYDINPAFKLTSESIMDYLAVTRMFGTTHCP